MDDNFLIEQAKTGNPQAFRLLVLRYQGPLFKFLSGFGLPAARIEELAQETLLRVYENLTVYRSDKGASFVTWLFVIAKRLALNELARGEHRFLAADMSEVMEMECHDPSPADALDAAQRHQRMRNALQQVDEPFRSALLLSYVDELKLTEIAEIEQCSLGTVKSRIFRGKQILARLIQAEEEDAHE